MKGGGTAPFLTSELDGGKWSDSHPGRFAVAKEPPVPIVQEAWWASEPVWTLWRKEKFVAPTGNRTLAVYPLARRYTD
jgi:hypothetical protein